MAPSPVSSVLSELTWPDSPLFLEAEMDGIEVTDDNGDA